MQIAGDRYIHRITALRSLPSGINPVMCVLDEESRKDNSSIDAEAIVGPYPRHSTLIVALLRRRTLWLPRSLAYRRPVPWPIVVLTLGVSYFYISASADLGVVICERCQSGVSYNNKNSITNHFGPAPHDLKGAALKNIQDRLTVLQNGISSRWMRCSILMVKSSQLMSLHIFVFMMVGVVCTVVRVVMNRRSTSSFGSCY
ncbi:hypothetical protein G7K_6408-t1 [Saitoella complicata NRRL Y-17804]|uniref:Uncharacterized protein n=1 Tax=Saitoella complicata (strain BCRC 22490 / CBS 7301 / JCM 7358 / NBRC 10748 / NRRL Y-17804) TaxID=698492 RepID=A0A0E9NR40_SAICN|nr:hypothetical protein G7K_6408-t1 [Saitoella complicata NRRL Y-17804]